MEKGILYTIGQHIRILRLRKSLTQEQLADIAGLHRNYIGAIERGERNLTVKSLARIADGLGCAITELLEVE